jgi:hypothetical protein
MRKVVLPKRKKAVYPIMEKMENGRVMVPLSVKLARKKKIAVKDID